MTAPPTGKTEGMLRVLAVLAAANVLNNRVAPRLAPVTSAAATGALVAIARRSGLSWTSMGFTRVRRGALAGAVLTAGVAAGYAAAIAHPRLRPLLADERVLGISRARLAEEILVQVPVGTVLLEEVGFRGVVYGLVERSHGHVAATAVSSGLFGLWHVLPAMDMARANPAVAALAAGAPAGGAGDPAADESFMDTVHGTTGRRARGAWGAVAGTLVATAAAGVLLCALRRRCGLVAPAALHTATNGLGFVAARVARRWGRSH